MPTSRRARAWLAPVIALALILPAAAQPEPLPECVVLLTDGSRYTGLLVERNDDELVLRIQGIDTRFPATRLAELEVLAPIDVRYHAMRDAIDNDDLARLILLAEWLRQRERFDVALAEIDHVLDVDPQHPRARELRRLVLAQMALADGDEPAGPGAGERPETFPVLSPDQVNLLKVYEIDLADPPKLLIRPETIDRLLDEYADSELLPKTHEGREAFRRLPPERILEYMFRLRARHFYTEVRVLGQPKALQRFRESVHSAWLINGCATARCHGGEQAGRIWLNSRKRNTEATVYTNFFILDRYRLPDGTPLIDYDQPALSPLLHMALPREKSAFPHPEVVAEGLAEGWRPIIRSTDDRRFVQAVEWIQSMYRPRPDYPIDYDPPVPGGLVEPLPEPGEPVDR